MTVILKETIVNNTKISDHEKFYELKVNDIVWMQFDKTYIVREQLFSSYDLAHGKVLLTGFGFGILADWIASKENVTEIHVIEKNADVIECFLKNNIMPDKVKIIIADASQYTSNEVYDCIFIDHYEVLPRQKIAEEVVKVSKNIPNHSIIWGWKMEFIYDTDLDLLRHYGVDHNKLLKYKEKFLTLPWNKTAADLPLDPNWENPFKYDENVTFL